MIESLFYEKHPSGEVTCTLCPHKCTLKDGKKGICGVRRNHNGRLYSENYGKVTAIHFDPIEKKPLYHYFPGSHILSIGTLGCNLSCQFCQNYEISQSDFDSHTSYSTYEPEEVIKVALSRKGNIGISYTYNEPSIWFEYIMDVAEKAKQKNLVNTMVTNGFINPGPLDSLISVMDAFNVDLKAFTDEFYCRYTSSQLLPVMESIKQIKNSGRHIEITNLVIPGLNDNPNLFRKMVQWIATAVGEDTVLHLSRYFPTYKMSVQSTPISTLQQFYDIAREYLIHVFYGNVHGMKDGKNTTCPSCGLEVIVREGYYTQVTGLDPGGLCSSCGERILKHYSKSNTK